MPVYNKLVRDKILDIIKAAFTHVHPARSAGFYNGDEKSLDSDMTFASIYTIAQKSHLKQFSRDAFDLIVVDEFHHAAAPTYNRLIEYLEPQWVNRGTVVSIFPIVETN